jgi:uncharacterized membrane protein YqjE
MGHPSDRRQPDGDTDLIGAIRQLTDGLTDLVRHQLELIRVEFRQELDEFRRHGLALALAAAAALLGYLFALVGVVLCAAWLGGLTLAGPASLGLGVIHLVGGAYYAGTKSRQLEEQRERIRQRTNLARELPDESDAEHDEAVDPSQTEPEADPKMGSDP